MDTRFWGPSGWRLLHLVSFQAPTLNATDLHIFFTHLPYVLPCKFCRASLSEYYETDPVPKRATGYAEWLYRIHTRVNNKLKSQNLLETPNPTWNDIESRYKGWIGSSCSKETMIGWDFLFSIAYTTPCKSVASTPMPNAPPLSTLTTPELRNRWNCMTYDERLPLLDAWWQVLPKVLPYKEWQIRWASSVDKAPNAIDGRRACTAWLFKAERAMCTHTETHTSYSELCSELRTFASGCSKKRSNKMKTCRSKTKRRHSFRTRRQQLYVATGGFL